MPAVPLGSTKNLCPTINTTAGIGTSHFWCRSERVMALKKPQPPPATRKAFRDGLAEMIVLGRAPKTLPAKAIPQRIYVLSPKSLLKGTGLDRAKPMLWEFLVGGGSQPAVIVNIGDPSGKKKPRMTSLTRDPMATEALEASRQVEALPRARRHRYELRRLRIGALSIGAFWLKSLETGRPDLAVPYHTIHKKLKRMHAYSMDEFLSVARTIVEQR